MNVLSIVERISKILSLIGIPVVLGVVGWSIQKSISEKTIQKDYVSLAVSILEKPKGLSDPKMRAWAVELLNYHSPVKLNEEISAGLTRGDLTLPRVNPSAALNRNKPILNKASEIIVVESSETEGRCVIQLHYEAGCRATYQWRYRGTSMEIEEGAGELFEQYIKVDSLNYPVGQTVFRAGPFILEWSCHGEFGGWIYSLPPTRIYSTSEFDFNGFRL